MGRIPAYNRGGEAGRDQPRVAATRGRCARTCAATGKLADCEVWGVLPDEFPGRPPARTCSGERRRPRGGRGSYVADRGEGRPCREDFFRCREFLDAEGVTHTLGS